jgi:26S proteasome non-ATPase regulatory subunit 10
MIGIIQASQPGTLQAGSTPLHVAAALGNIEIMKVLAPASSPAAINFPDSQGRTPLHVCVSMTGDVVRKIKCLAVLVRNGANLEVVDAAGLAALHYAADCGNLRAVQVIVKAGCNQSTPTEVWPWPVW